MDQTTDTARRARIGTEHLELFGDMADRQVVIVTGRLNGVLGLYPFDAVQLEAAISVQERLLAALPRIPAEQRGVAPDEMRATLDERMRRVIE